MSRENLYRGKRKDNGEWVEGSLLQLDFPRTETYIVDRFATIECDNIDGMEYVIPETVGQFTGLTDKNGKKIFEGDIVEFTDKYTRKKGRAKIVFEAFKWKYSGCYYGGNLIVWLCICDKSIEFEIIGNIHDNPELLEVEE